MEVMVGLMAAAVAAELVRRAQALRVLLFLNTKVQI
jgi:hypothetical protein